MRETRHIAEWIGRPAGDVYAFASDPTNIPRWAPGLGTGVKNVDGEWFVETADGRIGIRFAAPNEFGVLDHDVTLPSGQVISNPMRVVPDGDGCEVTFTLRRQPDMTDEDFARDAGLVRADLAALKRILESG
jgi:polyketide cyclase/dehydrase/lipid transport protein